ncbi:unnamed protein product [Durusdinium trenchii]|uniref:Uncharacterized protein n=1 Tax=Durusdinium trenchii TaxID=1381693 RepID=A0ABP0PTI3_9DINO
MAKLQLKYSKGDEGESDSEDGSYSENASQSGSEEVESEPEETPKGKAAKNKAAKAKAKAKQEKTAKPGKEKGKEKDTEKEEPQKPVKKTKKKKEPKSRKSSKGDDMIFRYQSWRQEFHIRDFMSTAEPTKASSLQLAKLTSRELRRAFYGYFRQFPGKKKKGEIRADLILEYTNLGRPGSNKSLQEVIADVEADMSKNLDFTLEKRGKNFILKCGKNEVALDPTKAWKQQIFKEPSGIPFVSDGKVSERCVNIFQKHEEAEAAAEVEGKPKDEKDHVEGYTLNYVSDGRVFLLFHGSDKLEGSVVTACPDWKIIKHLGEGKHKGDVFLHSPSAAAKPQWIKKLKFEAIKDEDHTLMLSEAKAKLKKEKADQKAAEEAKLKQEAKDAEEKEIAEAQQKAKDAEEAARVAKKAAEEVEAKKKLKEAEEKQKKDLAQKEEDERKKQAEAAAAASADQAKKEAEALQQQQQAAAAEQAKKDAEAKQQLQAATAAAEQARKDAEAKQQQLEKEKQEAKEKAAAEAKELEEKKKLAEAEAKELEEKKNQAEAEAKELEEKRTRAEAEAKKVKEDAEEEKKKMQQQIQQLQEALQKKADPTERTAGNEKGNGPIPEELGTQNEVEEIVEEVGAGEKGVSLTASQVTKLSQEQKAKSEEEKKAREFEIISTNREEAKRQKTSKQAEGDIRSSLKRPPPP